MGLEPAGASVHVLTAVDGPVRLLTVNPDDPRVGVQGRSEPVVLGGLETAVISAATAAYAIDAPASTRVLLARVP